MQTYISPRQASEKLNLTRRAIYKLIDAKEIPAIKLGGAWRIPAETLEKMLTEKMRGNCNG